MISRHTLLLVEDETSLREALAAVLRRQGYDVIEAGDGNQAMLWLLTGLPDAAVVDMMLPGTSGFVVARTIKEKSDGRTAVLMMSGNDSAAHRDYAFASGADLFLPKPFSQVAFLDAVRKLSDPSPELHSAAGNGAPLTSEVFTVS